MVALIYGVTGYTGALVCAAATAAGLPHVAAGRNVDKMRAYGESRGIETRAFALDDPAAIRQGLGGVSAVLNCAGPFARTAPSLRGACIEQGVHYLDLAGEVAEHAQTASFDDAAKAAGVMLLPGAGFGIVPTDCVAALAAAKVDTPTHLTIAYDTQGEVSRGTLDTVLRGISDPGHVRREGELEACRPGVEEARFMVEGQPIAAVTNPWRADLIGAFASTGVANIDTLATFPFAARFMMRRPWLMQTGLMKWIVDRMIRSAPMGPTEAQLEAGSTRVVAIARNAGGEEAQVAALGPEAYRFTADAAVACLGHALQDPPPGYQTPSRAMGAQMLGELPGVTVIG